MHLLKKDGLHIFMRKKLSENCKNNTRVQKLSLEEQVTQYKLRQFVAHWGQSIFLCDKFSTTQVACIPYSMSIFNLVPSLFIKNSPCLSLL